MSARISCNARFADHAGASPQPRWDAATSTSAGTNGFGLGVCRQIEAASARGSQSSPASRIRRSWRAWPFRRSWTRTRDSLTVS